MFLHSLDFSFYWKNKQKTKPIKQHHSCERRDPTHPQGCEQESVSKKFSNTVQFLVFLHPEAECFSLNLIQVRRPVTLTLTEEQGTVSSCRSIKAHRSDVISRSVVFTVFSVSAPDPFDLLVSVCEPSRQGACDTGGTPPPCHLCRFHHHIMKLTSLRPPHKHTFTHIHTI